MVWLWNAFLLGKIQKKHPVDLWRMVPDLPLTTKAADEHNLCSK